MRRRCKAFLAGGLAAVTLGAAAHGQAADAKGGTESLIGSWSQSVPIDLGGGQTGTLFIILTFGDTRFTFSAEFSDVDLGPDVPTNFTGSGVYETETSANPNRLTITYETLDGEPFTGMGVLIYEIVGTTLRLGSNSDETVPASFESAEFVEEYEAVGTRSVCSEASVGALLAQLEDLRMMAGLSDDFDNDGVPEDAVIELIRFVSCGDGAKVPTRTNIAEATQSAFLLNVSTLRQNGINDFAEVAAILGLTGTTTQAQMRVALQGLGFTVPANLALVTCNANVCRADAQLVNEVFFGDNDLDGDGLTNRQEFQQSGGDVNSFVNSATDEIPGIDDGGGCAASQRSGNAANPWDALLVAVAAALLIFRRRPAA